MKKIIMMLLITSCNCIVQASYNNKNIDYDEIVGLYEHMGTVIKKSQELGIDIPDLSLVQPRINMHKELEDLKSKDNLYEMRENIRSKVFTNHLLHYFPQETINDFIQNIDDYSTQHGVIIMEIIDNYIEQSLRNYLKYRPKGSMVLQKIAQDQEQAFSNYLIALYNMDNNDTDDSSDLSSHYFDTDTDSDLENF